MTWSIALRMRRWRERSQCCLTPGCVKSNVAVQCRWWVTSQSAASYCAFWSSSIPKLWSKLNVCQRVWRSIYRQI